MQKTLKHYRRKKAFCRFCMTDSPRSAKMVSFCISCGMIFLTPFWLMSLLAFFSKSQNRHISVTFFTVLSVIILLSATYSVILNIPHHKNKRKKISFDWSDKDFYCRHWNFVFVLIAAAVFFFTDLNYFSMIIIFLSGASFFIFAPDEKPLKKTAWQSFIAVIALIGFTAFEAYRLPVLMKKSTAKIYAKTQYRADIESFIMRENNGFSINKEPLKTLHEKTPQNTSDLYYDFFAEQSEAKKKLAEYKKKYPEFVKAVKDFSYLSPSHYGIGHNIPQGKTLYDMELATSAMREAARFYTWQMQCAPTDKKLIAECNQNLQKLRNWCLNSNGVIYRLTGIAIESMRLNALTQTLVFNDITEHDFNQLLGEKINWHKYFIYSTVEELTFMESLINSFFNGNYKSDIDSFDSIFQRIPHHLKIYLSLNYLFFAERTVQSIDIASSNRPEKEKLSLLKELERPTGLLVCDIFGPALEAVYKKFVQIQDQREMAKIAFKIIDYRRINGKLPADLNFLQTIPVDLIHGKKYLYRTGNIKLSCSGDFSYNGFIVAVDEKHPHHNFSHTRLPIKL